ncbi:hypothetical protein J6590_067806 [Homalodisca vitripennis]|nr:hypothetical protein J6590_067806 [Homalodisca vitripennis]
MRNREVLETSQQCRFPCKAVCGVIERFEALQRRVALLPSRSPGGLPILGGSRGILIQRIELPLLASLLNVAVVIFLMKIINAKY